MSEKKSRKGLVFAILAVALAVAGGSLWKLGVLPPGAGAARADSTAAGAVAEKSDAAKDDVAAVPVELARVERRAIDAYYKAASVIEADRLVDLVTRIQGRVRAVNAEEGDWVAKGAIVAELENDREQVQLRAAELKLEEQARLLERNRSMVQEGLISDQEFDTARSAYEVAETERDLARIALEETRIRAPFEGRVTERKVVLGQQVNPADALFTLGDFSPLRVRVHLPEAVARKLGEGQRVLVTPDALDGDLEGRIERVAPVVDPVTSTVRVTIRLDEGADLARVGGFVKVRITTETRNDALAVPKLALIEEGGLRSVFVAEADTVRKVEIRTGLYDETYVEVLDGLEPDWFVVQVGQGGLRDGTVIEPLNAAEVGWNGEARSADSPDDSVLARID